MFGKFKKIALNLAILCITFTFIGTIQTRKAEPGELQTSEAKLELSQKDIEALGLSQSEVQEFQKVIDWVNNLSEEDKKMLNQISKEMEEDMKSKGLDPRNPDDIFKWVDQTMSDEVKKEEKPEVNEVKEAPTPTPPETEKIVSEEISAITQEQIQQLIFNLINDIAEIRQSATAQEEMQIQIQRWYFEMQELIYLLHIISQEELLKYLISPEFEKLRNNLQKLYNEIHPLVPSLKIPIKSVETDNPYNLLGISLTAKENEIDTAYQKLKKIFSPEYIREKLEKENLSQEAIERNIKEAKISFKFIENAYETLKDPKQKNIIDKTLKEQEKEAKKLKKSANNAFNKILDSLSSNIYIIIADIHKLLERYKPEELEKAKKQEELEKRILQETQKPLKVTPTAPSPYRFKLENGKYEEFWEHLRHRDLERDIQRRFAELSRPKPSIYKEEPKIERPISKPMELEKEPDKKKPEKKEEKKVEKPEKKREEPEKEKPEKKEEKKVEKPDVDFERGVLINNIAGILTEAKVEVEIEKPKMPTRKLLPEEEFPTETEKLSITDLAKELNQYLISTPIKKKKLDIKEQFEVQKEKNTIKAVEKLIKENKLHDLWQYFAKLNPGPKAKIDNPTLANMWKEKVYDKYAKQINLWYNELHTILSDLRRREKRKRPIHPEKKLFHGLHIIETQIKEPKKELKTVPKKYDLPKFKHLEKLHLGVVRKYINEIKESFDNISKALGVKETF